jgi:lipopolysaccharide/colanic/teichoic acid biosynthesis glycosyltransferase
LKAGLAGAVVPSKLYGILAAGRPYVAAVEDACEVAAITRTYDAGLLAAPGDPADLADKLRALYRDRGLAARLGENGRQAALAFDRPVQVRAYDGLLRRAARQRRPRPSLGKRPLDVTLAALGLLASAPCWLLIALGIKLDDGGPVLFVQERVGRDGRRFQSFKFRSMVVGADARFGPMAARRDDPRVTRMGRLLRATALDELPQLVNILRGDMSFVGPRPLLPEEIEVSGDRGALASIPGYEERHRVRPGLTGVAQVFAPRDVPRRHKFRLDRLYVRRQGLWLDVRLVALSVWISLRGRWEHRGDKL